MTHSAIKQVFLILGYLVLALVLYGMIFTAPGQQILWGAIEPAVNNQWKQSTLDNGTDLSSLHNQHMKCH